MSNAILNDMQCLGNEYVCIPFSWECNGTSAPNATTLRGDGIASLARSNTGIYTATMLDTPREIQMFTNSTSLAAAADNTVSSFNASGKVFTINNRSAGSAADIANDASNRLGGIIWLRDGVGK